ncbi:MAG: protein serine/threonine phosphatase 2C family protein [Candidatus Heimdallarchaeota archaeon]|nr:protein serine/threonine phosphatase 2C family protein [Candidatus Heimdallarchaeota archaeon]
MTSLLVNEKQKNIQHGFASDIGTSHEQQDKHSHASTQNLELFGVFDGHGVQGAKIATVAADTINLWFYTTEFHREFRVSPEAAILGLFEKAEFACCEVLQNLCLDDCNIRVDESEKLQESAFNFTESGEWPSTYKPSSKHCGLRNVTRYKIGGTTGTILILLKNPMTIAGKELPMGHAWCGNVGDSSAYEWNESLIRKLTHDHKPTEPSEFIRVNEIYGPVVNFKYPDPSGHAYKAKDIFDADATGGVWAGKGIYYNSKSWDGEENWASVVDVPDGGKLAMSRALGDIHLKPAVSWVPTIQSFPPTESPTTFFVLASDGLWDAWNKREFCQFMDSHKEEQLDTTTADLITQNVETWKRTFSPRCGRDNTMICIVKITSP